jgi:hypothetical protein
MSINAKRPDIEIIGQMKNFESIGIHLGELVAAEIKAKNLPHDAEIMLIADTKARINTAFDMALAEIRRRIDDDKIEPEAKNEGLLREYYDKTGPATLDHSLCNGTAASFT